MRGGTVQINWHDTKPVLACDFHPASGLLATGGADYDIKLWVLVSGIDQKKDPGVTYKSNLSCHSSAVNALRFSPSGEQLASGADGGALILWKSHTTDDGEIWKVLKSLLFHRKDVLDIEWSADGAYLISASVDNSCIIWDANKGSVLQTLDVHSHYVQGVAWDPLGKYVASLSSDRTLRTFVNKPTKTKGVLKTNYVCQDVISKAELHITDESKSTRSHLFHDETLPSFFRRLAWSPDGAFLLVPAGSYKNTSSSEQVNTAYVFSRKNLSRPALMLPSSSKPIVAVRFCPIKFNLRGTSTSPFFKIPYRLIFAIASLNSLYVYDTESVQPIVIIAGVHYAAITDIAWSPTGTYLALSSQDGYCTILEFEKNELGSPLSLSAGEEVMADANKTSIDSEAINHPSKMASTDDGQQNVENPQQVKDDNKDENLASPCTEVPAIHKPAQRRITLMADANETSINSEAINHLCKMASTDDGQQNLENPQQVKDDNKDENLASPCTEVPAMLKPAKRRITPMAID